MSDLAPQTGTPPAPTDRRSAIDLLPESLREPARFFFGFFSDRLKGSTGFATQLRWWIREEGLTPADATRAMRKLMTPERSGELDTAPKVVAAFAQEVAAVLRERRQKEQQAKFRADQDRARAEAAPPDVVRQLAGALAPPAQPAR